MIDLVNPLDEVAACLAASSATTEPGAKVVYIATARARLEAVAERVKQLRWMVEAQEQEVARPAGPAQATLTTERTEP